jgi:hypothetical protein
MRLGTLIAILGLILSALAGLWYWQIMQVAAALAWTNASSDPNRSAWFAVGLFCVGLAIFVISMVINFITKDEDA